MHDSSLKLSCLAALALALVSGAISLPAQAETGDPPTQIAPAAHA